MFCSVESISHVAPEESSFQSDMRNFLIHVSPVFCLIVLLWSGPMLLEIFSKPLQLGEFWILILGCVVVGVYTGRRVLGSHSIRPKSLRVFLSFTSGLGITLLLPLIGVGGCCAVLIL